MSRNSNSQNYLSTESEAQKRHNYTLIIIILIAVLITAILCSIGLGRYPIPIRILAARLIPGFDPGEAFSPQAEAILFNVRLPRIILAVLVGCCLSAAGAAYQGVFRNPMASPDILGASAGAATGAVIAMLLQFSSQMVILFAFCGSLITIAAVMFISRAARGNKLLGIILAGIMVSSLCNAVTSYVKLVADPNDVLPNITYWLMGSLGKTKPESLRFAVIPMVIGLVPLILLRWRINLLTLSDSEARTMGVNAGRVRLIVIISATLITAASVSVSGLIGWVGLVVPHLTRRLVGNNYRHLMPTSMLCGAIFLLIVDNVSRNLLLTEIPIGILTAVIGAPFFIWLITRKQEAI